MSNLSDLLPAGSGGKNVDFVASGTLPNGKPVILNSDGTVTVVSPIPVSDSMGADSIFKNSLTFNPVVTMLSPTKAVAVYEDANNVRGEACVLTISGSSITAGTATIFETGGLGTSRVVMLTSTKVLVIYIDEGNSYKGTACVLDISGTTITAGTPTTYKNSPASWNSVAAISATQAIVTYIDNNSSFRGMAVILDISGTSISVGTAVNFEPSNSGSTSVAMLTPTKAIVAYMDFGNSSYGTACVLDISGTTITAGTPVVYENGSTLNVSVDTLSATQAIVTYRDVSNSGYGTTCILNISGSTITTGTPVVFNSGSTNNTWVAGLSSTEAIVAYKNAANSGYGTRCNLTVSGSTITAGTATVFHSGRSDEITTSILSPYKLIFGWPQGNNGWKGTAKIVQVAYTDTNLTSTNFIGITDEAIADTASGSVTVTGGVTANLTGLTVGSTYYVQPAGTLATSAGDPSVVAGKAISTTSLLLKGNS